MADPAVRATFDVVDTGWLRLASSSARFVFRGDAEARAAAGPTFGAPLANAMGRAVRAGERAALSLGPDELWFLVPERDASVLAAGIAAELGTRPHSLVDVGHRQVALELYGPHADWLLAAACPLPLDADAFPVDACTRTVFAKAEIVLWRTAADVFRVEVARSYCRYVVGLLGDVAQELPPAAPIGGPRRS